jgi:hypothetical protein
MATLFEEVWGREILPQFYTKVSSTLWWNLP